MRQVDQLRANPTTVSVFGCCELDRSADIEAQIMLRNIPNKIDQVGRAILPVPILH